MRGQIKYEFTTTMWQNTSPGGWHFVTIPNDISGEIRNSLQWQEEGWGRMKAKAQIADIVWESAIWFDTKRDAYLLPVKAEVRTKADLKINTNIHVTIWI